MTYTGPFQPQPLCDPAGRALIPAFNQEKDKGMGRVCTTLLFTPSRAHWASWRLVVHGVGFLSQPQLHASRPSRLP